MMKIHRAGWVYFICFLIISIVFFPFFPIIGLLFLLISFFIFYFFRDPERRIPSEDVIVSPADGKIVYIDETDLPEECKIKGKYLKISIFLDLYNVHINRIPLSGVIKDIIYIPGKFFRANVDKASKENERNIIVIENDKKEIIVVSQIAGLIARRIVCDLKINQRVLKGDKFGIIKFGSRVDIYLPKNYNKMINIEQLVVGGETIISNPNNITNLKESKTI
tara:strand:- start:397 stop:1062 length:666 start_codon:yes stop_codon:yes gene_type:complete